MNLLPARTNRWKWMAGATAATAAAATGAQGQIVQINLVDNQITAGAGGVNSLNANLTGTGPTLTGLMGSHTDVYSKYLGGASANLKFGARERGVASNDVSAHVFNGVVFPSGRTYGATKPAFSAFIRNHGKSANATSNPPPFSAYSTKRELLIPIALSSANVNGGVLTDALLEISADPYAEDLALTRLIYDKGDPDVGTAELMEEVTVDGSYTVIGMTDNGFYTPTDADVPEPSSLALLALGAGGLLARRLRNKAAQTSAQP